MESERPCQHTKEFPSILRGTLVSGPWLLRRPTAKNLQKGPLVWMNTKRVISSHHHALASWSGAHSVQGAESGPPLGPVLTTPRTRR